MIRDEYDSSLNLHPPEEWEHQIVERELIASYRKEAEFKFHWEYVAIPLIFLVAYTLLAGASAIGAVILRCAILSAEAIYLVYSFVSKKSKQNVLVLIDALEHQKYLVTDAWASQIRCVTGEGRAEAYGLAHIRLSNGYVPKKEFVLPYDYAKRIVKQGITSEQKVLVVYIYLTKKCKLIPLFN